MRRLSSLILATLAFAASPACAQDKARDVLIADAATAGDCRLADWDLPTQMEEGKTYTEGETYFDTDMRFAAALRMIDTTEAYLDLDGDLVVSAPLCAGGYEVGTHDPADDALAKFIAAGTANGCKMSGDDVPVLLMPLNLTDNGIRVAAQLLLADGRVEVDAVDDDILRFKTEGCS